MSGWVIVLIAVDGGLLALLILRGEKIGADLRELYAAILRMIG